MTLDPVQHRGKRFRFLSKYEFLKLTLPEQQAYVKRAFLELDKMDATFAGMTRRRSDLHPY